MHVLVHFRSLRRRSSFWKSDWDFPIALRDMRSEVTISKSGTTPLGMKTENIAKSTSVKVRASSGGVVEVHF